MWIRRNASPKLGFRYSPKFIPHCNLTLGICMVPASDDIFSIRRHIPDISPVFPCLCHVHVEKSCPLHFLFSNLKFFAPSLLRSSGTQPVDSMN